MGCHFLLQGIFLTQGLNPHLLPCRQIITAEPPGKPNSTLLLLLLSRISRVRLCATPWTGAYQATPSMGFSRQEYWSGLPFPSSGDLLDPGIEPRSPALQVDSLLSEPPEKPREMDYIHNYIVFGRACCKFGTLYMSKSNSSTEPA